MLWQLGRIFRNLSMSAMPEIRMESVADGTVDAGAAFRQA